jgi:hypothetical protein
VTITLSHRELSLALFALEGGNLRAPVDDPCSPDEHACPVADSLEEMFGARSMSPEKKLARHLTQHLQQGWLECGLMSMGPAGGMPPGQMTAIEQSPREQQLSARRMADNMKKWSCEIELDGEERRLLSEAIGRLPRSAWISMPRTMWRLRKKL